MTERLAHAQRQFAALADWPMCPVGVCPHSPVPLPRLTTSLIHLTLQDYRYVGLLCNNILRKIVTAKRAGSVRGAGDVDLLYILVSAPFILDSSGFMIDPVTNRDGVGGGYTLPGRARGMSVLRLAVVPAGTYASVSRSRSAARPSCTYDSSR